MRRIAKKLKDLLPKKAEGPLYFMTYSMLHHDGKHPYILGSDTRIYIEPHENEASVLKTVGELSTTLAENHVKGIVIIGPNGAKKLSLKKIAEMADKKVAKKR